MENFRGFLSGTRKELLLQFIFTLFVIVIPSQRIQLLVLGVSILIVGLLLQSKQLFDNTLFSRIQLLIKWVMTVGVGYFLFPIPWLAHISAPIAVFVASVWSVSAIVVPIAIFYVKYALHDNDQATGTFVWVIGFFIGQLIGLIVTAGVGGWFCWFMPVFVLIILLSILPVNEVWFVSNLIGGIIYSYILNLNDSSLSSRLICLLIASLSSSMITGLAYLVLFETKLSGSNSFENKIANKTLSFFKSLGQFILGFLGWTLILAFLGFMINILECSLAYNIFWGSMYLLEIGLVIFFVRKKH